MINKTELRIGSLVQLNGETFEVLNGNDIDILAMMDGEGIPVTNEVLSALFPGGVFEHMPRIDYLHQLQNWYACFAGEELDTIPYLQYKVRKDYEGKGYYAAMRKAV